MAPEKVMTDEEIDAFLSLRREAAQNIDPETAVVEWWYVDPSDPYDIDPVPEEYRSIGRGYFARCPESDIWVCFYDLPMQIHDALWKKHGRSLCFPAGIAEFVAGLRQKDVVLIGARRRSRLVAMLGSV